MDDGSGVSDAPLFGSPAACNNARVRRKILAAQAITRMGTQLWLFAMPPVLVEFTPESILAPALWGLSTMLVTAILGPSIGRWADRTCRRTVYTAGVALQLTAVVSAALVIVAGLASPRGAKENWTLLTMFLACEITEKLGEQVTDVSLKREWVPRLFTSEAVISLNSAIAAVDLAAQVTGPLLTSLLVALFTSYWPLGLGTAGPVLGAAGLLDAASFCPQLLLMRSVHRSHASLLQPQPRPAEGAARLERGAWLAWWRHPGGLRLLSLSEALLYLTVLCPSGAIFRAFLQLRRVPSWQASAAGGAGAALGLCGTLLRPALGRRLGGRAADGSSVCFEAACIAAAAGAFHAAGGTGTSSGGGAHLAVFMSGCCLGRLGLYSFCLGLLNRKQELVDPRFRSAVGAVDAALTSTGTVLTYGASVFIGRTSQFGLLVSLSAFFVSSGAALYLAWAAFHSSDMHPGLGDPKARQDGMSDLSQQPSEVQLVEKLAVYEA